MKLEDLPYKIILSNSINYIPDHIVNLNGPIVNKYISIYDGKWLQQGNSIESHLMDHNVKICLKWIQKYHLKNDELYNLIK